MAGLPPSPCSCPPAPAGRRRAATGCEGSGGAPGVAALGAGADFYFAYVQPGASRAPSRPCNCKVTQPGTGAAASARTRRRPGQGEARATPQPRGARAAATPAAREREEREGREGRGSAPVSARRPSAARPSSSSAAAVRVLGPAPQRRRAAPSRGEAPPAGGDGRQSFPSSGQPPPPALFPSLPRNLHNAVGRAAGARLSGGVASAVFVLHGQRRAADRTCRDAPGDRLLRLLHLPWQMRRANTLSCSLPCPHLVSQ